ncbi:AAA family ATPase [Streptomyces cocklensis]|uniref:LuxR family transcriptional regulator n=1 Tax=Actinacidiphila cocklensis TaxID=887465 RepID=A0A9W4DKY1_9ACTN|nr:LuxR family transcriptional regulator [Actinacidiphila cocklensis]MDD1062707.1 AAA family ATPase [Actinacidiphila cocklensis]CAG6392062.1 LuxR family transcriptional regulator [Actinacidiphila cocklensis]
MARGGAGTELIGRREECRVLDGLLTQARAGRSGVLVVRGEAGIGKTELLNHLLDQAVGCRVVRAAGVQSEMELSYAGLHQLCAPLLPRLDALPEPQRNALRTAFGMQAGDAPDRFLVSLAVLTLLAEAGGEEPLLCLVDDAQWLDRVSAQTLEFVARRLLAESVLLVLAVRESGSREILADLPELPVRGLDERDSHRLLDAVVTGPLDRRVRDRIVAETRGNPLALLELPRGLTAVEMAGGFGGPEARPLSSQIETGFLRRIRSLPAETQQLLLIAAIEPIGDVALLRRAAERLGICVDTALTQAEASGLLILGTWVRFRHPLVRSAAYRAVGFEEQRRVHKALADSIDVGLDPERRVWHLASATAEPDEAVAAELEGSAERAQRRGGIAAAAAFLYRATELTPDPARRGARALATAQATYQAGAFDAALELVDAAELSRLDEAAEGQATLLRGQIMSAAKSASAGLPLLLEAARRLQPYDSELAVQTYRDAIYAALTAGRLATGGVCDVAEAVLSAPGHVDTGSREGLLLTGIARAVTDGYAVGAPVILEAVATFRTESVSREEALGWLPLVCRMAHSTWDFDAWSELSARLVDLARSNGALAVLPSALLLRLSNRVFAGDLRGAASLAVEADAIGEATGSSFFAHYGALLVESFKGREALAREAIETVTHDRLLQAEGKVTTATQWASAVLCNGLGRYEEAYVSAERGCENPQELGLSLQSRVEFVEAAVRLGRAAHAAEAVRTIEEMAQVSGTAWARGISAATRALLSVGRTADGLHREGIEQLDTAGTRMDSARARLRYGEWLRSKQRRKEARIQLSEAYEMLSDAGAEAFAERARRELQAAGVKVHERAPATPAVLTAKEAEIARLAQEGFTNPEIGARLFLSPHTVEWHLRKVFAKLGISSRKDIDPVQLEDTATTS